MNVTVKYANATRLEMDAMRDALLAERAATPAFVDQILISVKNHLLQTRGEFVDAKPVKGLLPRTFDWVFTNDWELRFTIRDSRRWWFLRDRKITIIRIKRRRPGHG